MEKILHVLENSKRESEIFKKCSLTSSRTVLFKIFYTSSWAISDL